MNLFTRLRETFFGPTPNCKPGDLAIIVAVPGPETARLLGRIIRVTVSHIDGGELCWSYEGPPLMQTEWSIVAYVEDEFLRPILPDGITDAEVRELYLSRPVKAKEPA